MKIIDIYRGGPPPASNWAPDEEEMEETARMTRPADPERDRLVMVTAIPAQAFQEDQEDQTHSGISGLLCLWRSNRLCILSSDWKVYDQMLLDDTAPLRTRTDIPICATLLSDFSDSDGGGCSLLVSYTSMILRWWRVSLHASIQQACLVLHSPVTHLAALSCDLNVPNERPVESRQRESSHQKHAAERAHSTSSASPSMPDRPDRPDSVHNVESLHGHGSLADTLEPNGGLTESTAHILVAAMDETRAVTLFLGYGANIKPVYSVDETWGATVVDGIWIMDTHIALLLRSGDVRHIEFDFNSELMRLGDLFTEA